MPLLALSMLVAAVAVAPPPKDGADLVRQMHARYAGSWYRTLTFVQTTTFANGRTEIWYEAGSIPGKLRIDIAPLDSSNATMYVGDSAYVFRGGKRVNARKDRNLLMTLGFDVYAQAPAITMAQLTAQGVDASKLHESTWQGRKVWVVGAAPGDTTATQFWIEQDRLLFVRLIEQHANPNDAKAPPTRLDVEFNKYEPLGKGWIAPEVIIRVNGRDFMKEEYADVHADVTLPADLFTTAEYRKPAWIPAPAAAAP